MRFDGVTVKKSMLERSQFDDGLGVFADRDFQKGEVVIKWSLKIVTREQYEVLPEREKSQFTHKRDEIIYYYPEPERHVNRSKRPNAVPDFEKGADVALRVIRKGEEITIPDTAREDS
jgi:hypothetical protein